MQAMREHTKRLYVTPETHAAVVSFCDQRGLQIQFFVDEAIKEAIAARSIARHWDGKRFVNYVVEYPQGTKTIKKSLASCAFCGWSDEIEMYDDWIDCPACHLKQGASRQDEGEQATE